MSAEVFAALLVWSLTLPWALMMARYKVPSSGTPCPLSQMAPKTDPTGANPTPTNSRAEGRGGWVGEGCTYFMLVGVTIVISRKYTLRGLAFPMKATLFLFI